MGLGMPLQPYVIFLSGPTAAGKTAVALDLVKHLPCEIISVDSAMVYRGMDIGTAKPGAELLAQAPHRLIDIRAATEPYSAADFRADALREIGEIIAMGRIPLLVGGTMLYFRALQYGLSELPAADASLRSRLQGESMRLGNAAMHARLAGVDPVAAARIHPNDPQRVQRALEIFELTGVPMSVLYERSVGQAFPYRVIKIVLSPASRELLHQRIAQRLSTMLAAGFVEEVKALMQHPGIQPDLPAMRAVGYRQVWDYLTGCGDYEQMQQRIIYATRQYAKRQLTWLRAEDEAEWFDSQSSAIGKRILRYIKAFPINIK